MRPKVTFRGGRRHPANGAWVAEFAKPDDVELSPELREILTSWRCNYALADAAPRRQDVRATLEALSRLDADRVPLALAAVDPWSEAQLATAALRRWRQSHPAPSELPLEVLNPASWSAEEARELARVALQTLPPASGGRPSTAERDVAFARVLRQCYARTRARRIAAAQLSTAHVISRYPSFPAFAGDMFARLGRRLRPTQLRALLHRARKGHTG